MTHTLLTGRIATLLAALEAALAEDLGLAGDQAGALAASLETVVLTQVRRGEAGGLAPWQARRVERHVDLRLASPIRVQDLARLTRLSASHFTRSFKIRFGATPRSWINDRRIDRAKAIMLRGPDKLSRIALDCGFSDQSHLSRVFKRSTGMSPAAWRRSHLVDEPWTEKGRTAFAGATPHSSASDRHLLPQGEKDYSAATLAP